MLITFLFSSNWLNTSRNFAIILMLVSQTCLFPSNKKSNGKLSLLDIEVSRGKAKFVTTVYRKPAFSGALNHFENFLPKVYKFGMIYTLAYRCFKVCSDWTKFHEELGFFETLLFWKRVPFVILVDKLFIKRLQLTKIEKKTLFLSLRYLGEIPLQTRAELRKSLKGLLNSCKLQIVFKCQRKLSNVFGFKDLLPFDLVHGVVYRYVW